MNNKCIFCGNKNFSEKKVQYIYRHDSEFFIVNGVPCIECDFCGEQYFNGKELENIEKLFFDIHYNKRLISKMLEVPVEDYGENFL